VNMDRQTSTYAPVIAGLILILVGALLLLAHLERWSIVESIWPLYIIALGALFFVGMVVSGPAGGPLAIPGSVIPTMVIMLLARNMIGHRETWTYAWTLIAPAGVGLGLLINSW